MKVLIKAATIVSPSSPLNGHTKSILIENGIVSAIGDELSADNAEVIDIPGLHVSPGWMDIFAHFNDPGEEFKETLETGARAAAAGGFTDVMVLPNTKPVVHDKSMVEYIRQKSRQLPVNLHPVGAITRNAEGKELAELYDMRNCGAIAFSDGKHAVQSAGLLLKALQYVLSFDGTVIQVPGDNSIGKHGLMNEGIISTQLGLPGKPAIAEELMVARDIELLKYTNSRLHFTGISTRRSHELILKAKAEGLRLSCSVSPAHIFFCDEDLQSYDTNLKVDPPLRSRADMMYLREALKNGTIDCLASHHFPQDYDHKVCEFEYAANGMISLETLFAVAITSGVSPETFIKMQAENTREIFGIASNAFSENMPASLSLFLPDEEFVLLENEIQSASKNSPFTGKKLKGSVVGIINGTKVFLKELKLANE